jgi:hypothetical protein
VNLCREASGRAKENYSSSKAVSGVGSLIHHMQKNPGVDDNVPGFYFEGVELASHRD